MHTINYHGHCKKTVVSVKAILLRFFLNALQNVKFLHVFLFLPNEQHFYLTSNSINLNL